MSNFNLKTDIGNKRKDYIALGRKTKKSGEQGKHNKFSDDNLTRKIKHIILENLMEFINETIKKVYKGNIGFGMLKKQLLIIDYKLIKNTYVEYNKNFLNKSLGDIFSEDICKKYTNFPLNHNKNLVSQLMNEDDEKIKNLFTIIFNLTFKEVIRHIKRQELINELHGLKDIDVILKKYEDDPNYLNVLKYYIFNYEFLTQNKKSRRPRNQEEEIKKNEY